MLFHELVERGVLSPQDKGRAPLLINLPLEEDFICLWREGWQKLLVMYKLEWLWQRLGIKKKRNQWIMDHSPHLKLLKRIKTSLGASFGFDNSTLHQANLISFHSRSIWAREEAEKVVFFNFMKTLSCLPQLMPHWFLKENNETWSRRNYLVMVTKLFVKVCQRRVISW